MPYYIIEDNEIVGISEKPISDVYSDERRNLGDSYVEGAFGDPIKTYAEKMEQLNKKYIEDLDQLASKITKAKAWDGVNEESKVETLRSQKQEIDSAYVSDITILANSWSD